MASDAAVSKSDLRRHIVPYVKKFLKESGKAEFFREKDQVGHNIHTHASDLPQYPAEVIYETTSWVEEFLIWIEEDNNDLMILLAEYGFELGAYSSVVLEVRLAF